MRGDRDRIYTIREQGYGVATVANLWVLLFPITIFLVYCFCTASLDSFVSNDSWGGNGSELDVKEGANNNGRQLEMKSLVDNDELSLPDI